MKRRGLAVPPSFSLITPAECPRTGGEAPGRSALRSRQPTARRQQRRLERLGLPLGHGEPDYPLVAGRTEPRLRIEPLASAPWSRELLSVDHVLATTCCRRRQLLPSVSFGQPPPSAPRPRSARRGDSRSPSRFCCICITFSSSNFGRRIFSS